MTRGARVTLDVHAEMDGRPFVARVIVEAPLPMSESEVEWTLGAARVAWCEKVGLDPDD